MPPSAPVSPAISARIIHAALVSGVILFCGAAWYIGSNTSMPVSAVPDRRVLYLGLVLASGVLFGAAMYTAGTLTPTGSGGSQDDWWRANLARALVIWALVEAPALLGTVAYLLTHDFRPHRSDRPAHVRELSAQPAGRGVNAGGHATAGRHRDRGGAGGCRPAGGHLA